MDTEVPCRDTDPVNMNLINKTADNMTFTIDFSQQQLNQEEKMKKFERFAQRSSLRRGNSPRNSDKSDDKKQGEDNNKPAVSDNKTKESTSERRNTVVLERSSLTSRLSSVTGEMKGRSVSHNRLMSRKPVTRTKKSSENEDALSHTGTYTMDEDQNYKKVPA